MLKLIGTTAVFSSLCWVGFHRAAWYGKRVACLEQWMSVVEDARRMLCDWSAPTGEFLQRLRECLGMQTVSEYTIRALDGDTGVSVGWQEGVLQSDFPLRCNEIALVCSIGDVIGRYDPEQQRRYLDGINEELKRQTSSAREERDRLSRMWRLLGISSGFLAVVLLF